MSKLENIMTFLSPIGSQGNPRAPLGFCLNCWGRQEYSGNFYEAVKTEADDTLNLEKRKGWIQAYVENNLSGIQLQRTDASLVCNNCKVNYALQD